jgi:hypothetical protein
MKSIDLGTLLPKSTEVARNRQVEQQRPATVQQQFAAEAQKQVQRRQQSVQRSAASEKARIGQDQREGQGRGGQRRSSQRGGPKPARPVAGKAGEPAGREAPDGRGRFVDIVLGWMDGHGE